MSLKAEESIVLSSFKLKIADISDVELAKLHALSITVGWPHRAEDWEMLRDLGHGIVALDEIGRALGTAMWFPYGPDFATIGMVITSPRLQAYGAGRWMMEHVLAQAGPRDFGLNATRAARRLYLSMGFTATKTVYQCQGEAVAPEPAPPAGASLRDVGPADLAELAALDRNAYGVDRLELLARLLEVSKGVALMRRGQIRAFALCRRFGRGHVIGPVVAETDEDAIAVIRPHVAGHAGRFLRLDTRQQTGAFPEFLARSGLQIFDTVTSMWLDRPLTVGEGKPGGKHLLTYALASQTLG
ncbi:GNAT family N-acetyltransferase [Allomesorhizobium camelthorni]|uniref:GNAT family N-acetyltransferase n=1 Tax=Allomesorhizobium camelthorni TaxID=475069 RepID=A0A6G4W9I9_9HYPH|nr:GNAT family N-acetyltransferase [Mesorhizobium camelthorni]NGO50820.1 GNAT family N-acetyltransferase [Mesorhizobium camelthorni]